jgi:hypothetical protein
VAVRLTVKAVPAVGVEVDDERDKELSCEAGTMTDPLAELVADQEL